MQNEKQVKITVLASRVNEMKAEIEKLLRKAHRYGCNDIGFSVGSPYLQKDTVTDWDGSRRTVSKLVCDVEVFGEAPRVGNYEFLAHLEITTAGNIVYKVPGVEVDEKFWHSSGYCDHCGITRQRKDCFVVRNVDTGEQSQVGRTCLRDFLGTDTPASVIARFSFLKALGGVNGEGYDDAWSASVEGIALLGVVCIKLFGWCSKGQAMKNEELTSTAEYAGLALVSRAYVSESQLPKYEKILASITDEDRNTAQSVVAWVRNEMSLDGDYAHNLSVIFASDYITDYRKVGLVVSAVAAYHRAKELKLRRTYEASQSLHMGEVGQRLRSVPVTKLASRVIGDSAFGEVILHKFRADNGAVLSWFTNRNIGGEVGERLIIDGTVKEHKEYNGVRETQLSRVAVKKFEPIGKVL